MIIGEIAGYLASITASLALLPQVIKTVKTHDSKSLSSSSLFLMLFCNICWFLNALAYNNPALMFSAFVINCMVLPLIVIKIKNNELLDRQKMIDMISRYASGMRTDP